MRIGHKFCLLVVLLAPVACFAQTKCPWMNEATAGGILGGEVTVGVKTNGPGDGVCEFSHQQGTEVHQLTISVELMTNIPKEFPTYLAKCPPKSATIRAVGNEAVECRIESNKSQYGERVIGRVREQAFVVTVSTTAKNDPSMTQAMCREKADRVAEQVAGILF